MTDNVTYDVIIIGGSYAGLSAAMALGRSLRKVLIIDSGKPCNSQTPHSHNFLTQDGVGVYAAGDNTTMFRSVSAAVAACTKAGALINKELIDEDF